MKVQIILFTLVACLATNARAEISCPPSGDTQTGIYFPHPTNCSKFFTCHWGNLVELSCPNGTFWNEVIKACDLQGNVVCSSQPEFSTTESTTTEATTTESTTTESTTTESTTAESTTTESTTAESTTTEATTTESTTVESTTTESTTTESSTTEATTTESTTAESATTTTELPTTMSTTSDPSTNPSGQCPDSYDPNHQVYLPHADCTKYYICTWGGVALEQNCPPNLHWNQNLSYCDYPAQAGCSSNSSTSQPTSEPVSSTTSTPTSTSPSTPSLELPGNCPAVYDPNHQVFFPHADCTKYYICTLGGVAFEQNCPPNLHWNQNHSYCDYPAQAGCSPINSTPQPTSEPVSSTTSTPTSTSPATPSVELPGDCPAVYDPNHQVYFPHADCTKYYICTYEGNKLEQNCPPNLHWNPNVSYCDFPAQAGCSSINSTPQPTPAPATTTTTAATTTTASLSH